MSRPRPKASSASTVAASTIWAAVLALLTASGLMRTGWSSSQDSSTAATIRMSRLTTAMTSHSGSSLRTPSAM